MNQVGSFNILYTVSRDKASQSINEVRQFHKYNTCTFPSSAHQGK